MLQTEHDPDEAATLVLAVERSEQGQVFAWSAKLTTFQGETNGTCKQLTVANRTSNLCQPLSVSLMSAHPTSTLQFSPHSIPPFPLVACVAPLKWSLLISLGAVWVCSSCTYVLGNQPDDSQHIRILADSAILCILHETNCICSKRLVSGNTVHPQLVRMCAARH